MPGKLQVISGTQKGISNCKVVISFSFDVILLLRIHFNPILKYLEDLLYSKTLDLPCLFSNLIHLVAVLIYNRSRIC